MLIISSKASHPQLSTLFVALLSTMLVACPEAPAAPRYQGAGSAQPRRGGDFVFYSSSDVRTLDPHLAYDVLSTTGIKLIFDGLLDYDYDAKLVPSLAESMPDMLEEGKLVRFRLRRNVYFHNNRPFQAQDVKWSIEHMLHPDKGSPAYPFFTLIEGLQDFRDKRAQHIRGIRVVDTYTIDFRLTQPDQTFLHAMAMTFAHPVPSEHYGNPKNNVTRKPIGTGPFILDSWEPGVRMIFRRNPRYWKQGTPYVERMVFLLNVSADSAVRRFRNAELDILEGIPLADYLFFHKSDAWKPYWVEQPQMDLWGLAMNCEMPPFNNRHVRRAVSFAINRPWWQRAQNYRTRITGQPIPPGLLGYERDLKSTQHYDLNQAKKEMTLAGYPKGIREPVTMWIGESPSSKKIGELTQSDLSQIGIKVELKQVSFPVYLEATATRKTTQLFLTGWSQDFPDPADFLDILFHSRAIHDKNSENRAFYRSAKLDQLLDEARSEGDIQRRERLYRDAQKIIIDDAPWAFVWNGKAMEVWQPHVKNFKPHPVWPSFYRDVWLDLPRRPFASKQRN